MLKSRNVFSIDEVFDFKKKPSPQVGNFWFSLLYVLQLFTLFEKPVTIMGLRRQTQSGQQEAGISMRYPNNGQIKDTQSTEPVESWFENELGAS